MDDKTQLVVIKHYTVISEAYIDQGMLQANGIECSIGNPNMGSMFPILEMATLSVAQSDEQRARELVVDADDAKA